jgi:hypothetical protein
MNLGRNAIWGLLGILAWTVLTILPDDLMVQADPLKVPAPYPPTITQKPSSSISPSAVSRDTPPNQEWTYHKTVDNQHPDGNEQQMMWLMNRARSNPPQEGAWLAATGDPLVEDAIQFFGVDLVLMQSEFDQYPARPPAAFDVRLYKAAKAHCDDLIARDTQDHVGQDLLIKQMGFYFDPYARVIAYSYAKSALFGHAAFNIDWGDDGDDDRTVGSGVQPDRAHRLTIMSLDNPETDYAIEDSDTNVGLAVVPCNAANKQVGPLVIAGDFCHASTAVVNQFNRFLVGTVWQDTNGNDQYDPGEGMGGITVAPDHGTYFAITADSGGYAIPITSEGTYDVTFSGPGIDPDETLPAVVGSDSVLLDLPYTSLPQVITDKASDITTNTSNLYGSVITFGHATEYYFEYGTTIAYGSSTSHDSTWVDGTVIAAVNGLAEDTIYHFRLVASNSRGTSYGDDQIFQTSATNPPPPQAITGAASEIDTDAAYLNGSVVTHGEATEYYFEYGTATTYGTKTDKKSATEDGTVSAPITGLAPYTVYHFRLVASNTLGTSAGDDQTFRTPLPTPKAVTGAASGLTADAADLNGSVVTYGQATKYYFQYGTTDAYGTDTAPQTVAADTDVTATVTSLTENTVYHFRLVASNSQGTSPDFGADQTFKTSVVTPSGDDTPDTTPSAGSSGGGGGGCFVRTMLDGDP